VGHVIAQPRGSDMLFRRAERQIEPVIIGLDEYPTTVRRDTVIKPARHHVGVCLAADAIGRH
jgi:hypothetical protein